MSVRIQLRRDYAATWTNLNPVLADTEAGYEKDTGQLKFGDGTTEWNSLPYFSPHEGAEVLSFNTRTGAVTLSKSDVTGTGVTYSDVGADAAGAAASAQSAATAVANAKVASVAAGDATVTVGGTATAPTVKVTSGTFDAAGAAAAAQSAAIAASDTSGAAASAIAAAETYADRYAGSAAGTSSRPLAATDATTTNARTPSAHASSHASAGSDAVALAESQVTGLTTDLGAKLQVFNVAATVGASDNTAALNSALAAAYAAGGGTIVYPATGTYKHLGQILVPTNGANPPLSVPIRITGQGASYGINTLSLGATRLDFRYAGRTITDLVTDGTITVTSATAAFTSADIGAFVKAPGITSDSPPTVIKSVTNSTTAVLNQAALTTASGQTAVIGGAKIEALGWGLLTVDNCDLVNDGTDPLPILRSTNTICKLSCGFSGVGNATTCVTDAWIAGGVNPATNTGTPNDGFQGYGSVVKDCGFHRIRRWVVAPASGTNYFNGVPIHDNICDTSCGSALTNGAPIELYNGVANTIHDNTVEVVNYPIGVAALFGATSLNTLGPNGAYDETSTTQAIYYFGSNAAPNLIIDGFHDETLPLKIDTAVLPQTVIGFTYGQPTQMPYRAFLNNAFGGYPNGVFKALSAHADSAWLAAYDSAHPDAGASIQSTSSMSFTDGVTNSTTTVTSATAAFVSNDYGSPIMGAGLPNNVFITKVVNTTTVIISKAATASATGVTIYINRDGYGTGTAWTLVKFERNHILSQGSAPSGASDTAAGTGKAITVTGTDMAGSISLTVGTGSTAGQQLHVAPSNAWTVAPKVILFPTNALAAGQAGNIYNTEGSNPFIALQAIAPLAAGVYTWDWVAIQ
jgi:hypothetical protein